ncbi:hypothetical protein BMBtpLA2_45 [Bacillus phage vB_BtS_BMBtp14]|uniref:Uncharacterized protein n=1 Tax=Bacillus phage vB_BtS_BMBtp14 TaxID=1868826 RepID=A0A1B1P7C4_9CAUD|nr:hypothetical protein HWA95_gp45 [Bacillus phage vB_BtS_BMBtp14]ANT40005.1 hypothetical protein BMBtpLA2_45 [Bacillus phage vB_BtS_BMBtp14]
MSICTFLISIPYPPIKHKKSPIIKSSFSSHIILLKFYISLNQ